MDVVAEAKKLGIADIDTHGANGKEAPSGSLALAVRLMKKHGQKIYARLEKRRREQKRGD
jgi:hypothetical protein